MRRFVYVGSYTSADRNGRGSGISVFRAEAVGLPWTHLQTLATIDNPSLLRTASKGRMLYAVHGGRTTISAFAVDPVNGRIAAHGNQQSGGENPVDIGFLGGDRFLVTANYSSGTVAVLPLDETGGLQPACQIIPLARPGYRADEQSPSMPHGVTVDRSGNFVLIPCKGLDSVFIFRFDSSGQLLPAQMPFAACKPGSGPRHAVFHPRLPVLYVVGELGSCVQTFRWDAANGSLQEMQIRSSLPDAAAPQSAAAEIAIAAHGRDLYASNRGHDSIVHFLLDEATGSLGTASWTPCFGHDPRFFALAPDGRALHVANQESDTIVSFPLTDAGQLGNPSVSANVGSPSSICFGAPSVGAG
ncbi:MAG: lactonase family protein [Candidatus Velthaea sp.]|jgi:6-phosphogluconolactonase (cycloisomerase 2 family)